MVLGCGVVGAVWEDKEEEVQKLLEPGRIHCSLHVHTAVQTLYMNAV